MLEPCGEVRAGFNSPHGIVSEDLYDLLRRVIADHRLNVRGKQVVLKPNLVEFDEKTVINTNPKLVHAAWEAFRAVGAADVRIAEGPGHRRVTLDLAEAAGYFATVPGSKSLFTDLNLDEFTPVILGRHRSSVRCYLPIPCWAATCWFPFRR